MVPTPPTHTELAPGAVESGRFQGLGVEQEALVGVACGAGLGGRSCGCPICTAHLLEGDRPGDTQGQQRAPVRGLGLREGLRMPAWAEAAHQHPPASSAAWGPDKRATDGEPTSSPPQFMGEPRRRVLRPHTCGPLQRGHLLCKLVFYPKHS